MSDQTIPRATRYLPQVAVATSLVVLMPAAVVWWLRADGVVVSLWLCVLIAIAVSWVAASAGSAYWKRRRRAGDLFFSELLIWGWLRRWRDERQLADAVKLLGLKHTEQQPRLGRERKRTAQLLEQLAGAFDAQDPYTNGHSRRVAAHAAKVARRMGLSGETVATIRAAAAVHDVGKLRVPAEVLNKPGTLTREETEIMRRHADEGAQIVGVLGDRELSAIVRHHHERFDGTGYPAGLLGEGIPLGARIVAVADTFDAITSVRPYRAATSHKAALDVLVRASGTQLDPVAVRAFRKSYSGNRVLVFWALLAVSPQRAVASLRGAPTAPGVGSLAAVIASAAVVAAAGVTALGALIGGGPRPYEVHQGAQLSAGRIAATSIPHPVFKSAVQTISPRQGAPRAQMHRHAGAGVLSATGHLAAAGGQGSSSSSGPIAGARSPAPTHRGGGSGSANRESGPGAGRSPGSTSGGSSHGGPGPGHNGGGSGHHPGTSGSGAGSGGAGSSGSGGGSGSGASSGSGGGSGGAGGSLGAGGSGGSSGSTSASGGTLGPAGGGSASGSGAGDGGGSGAGGGTGGSAGSEPQMPVSKAQCMNDGYRQFGFPNQGQCIAYVERGSH